MRAFFRQRGLPTLPDAAAIRCGDAKDDVCPSTLNEHACHAKRPPRAQDILSVRAVAKNRFRRCERGSLGAPEARGLCRPNGTCAPVNDKTHAYDVGAKVWALPLIADLGKKRHAEEAAAVADVAAAMRSEDPRDRPSFSEAIATLERALVVR